MRPRWPPLPRHSGRSAHDARKPHRAGGADRAQHRLLLKLAPDAKRANLLPLALVLGAVFALNGARFVTWGALHRRFPISVAYPVSAVFFPAVVAMAWFMGEPVGALQLAGATLVMAGVARILFEAEPA